MRASNKLVCEVFFQGIEPPLDAPSIREFCLGVFSHLEIPAFEISVLFCRNDYIQSLNKEFRKINAPTDILSFQNLTRPDFVSGDIVISVETLNENAGFFKVPAKLELRRLLIHGILHLAGHDHATNDFEKEPMLKFQEEILKFLSNSLDDFKKNYYI